MLMASRIKRKLFLRWRNNGLSITLFVLFVAFLIAQSFAGWHEQNAMQLLQGGTPQSYGSYLGSPALSNCSALMMAQTYMLSVCSHLPIGQQPIPTTCLAS